MLPSEMADNQRRPIVSSNNNFTYRQPEEADFGDLNSFNILNYIDTGETPVDSPANRLMYAPCLPESPPITDSGAGSAGSPDSDSPYSPDFHQFHPHPPVVHHHHHVPHSQLDVLQSTGLIQMQQRPSMVHYPLPSPQPGDFMNGYPSSGHLPQVSPPALNIRCAPSSSPYEMEPMEVYCNERKRSRLDSSTSVKPEPTSPIGGDGFDLENYHQQAIRFNKFQEETWHPMFDMHGRPLNQLEVHVVADKGFNYSALDGCFVNQKKNHFQISVHIEANDATPPKFVKVGQELKHARDFRLAFCGVKAEMPSSEIQIRQSQTDRKPIPHDPVEISIVERRVTKVVVPRLHFSETTMNNQRKNGRPNPDQKYILLVVSLNATMDDGQIIVVQTYASEKVIVRASNPGQFDNGESDAQWQKNGNVLHYGGQVAIGTERASCAPLTVAGDIHMSGQLQRPSDRRLKEDIADIKTSEALSRLAQLRVVEYAYKPEIAAEWGLSEDQRRRVGVIAQELAMVLPDAVKEEGDFLTVDDSRIFYDTVAAAQELCILTGNLEGKIDEVEKISQRLARYVKLKKLGSMASGISEGSSLGFLSDSRPSLVSRGSRHHGGHGHHRCTRHSCGHRSDQALCSSKFTQGTIVTLVFIMALCLIAMSTLYVLDWHKRNFPDHRTPSIDNSPISTTTPDAPLNIEEDKTKATHPTQWTAPNLPEAPLIAPCLHGNCPSFCCADNQHYEHQQQSNNGGNKKIDTIVGLPRSTTSRPSSMIMAIDKKIAGPLLTNGVLIELPELNVTIDQRFCAPGSCQPRRGNFNLYVPISPFLPTIPLQIRFSVGNRRFVDSCTVDFKSKDCNWADQASLVSDPDHQPTASRISEEEWRVSAGDFLHSAYKFRVGYTTESCRMSEEHMGKSYDEFNIVFYRHCSSV